MFSETEVTAETVQAYLVTEFRVLGSAPFTLKINDVSPELSSLYRQHHVQCAAFLTAWNPYSEILTPAENEAAKQRLCVELNLRQLRFMPGVGLDPSGEWQGEESFLALGLSLEDARYIGSQFKQNGIVWAGQDAMPRLILLR